MQRREVLRAIAGTASTAGVAGLAGASGGRRQTDEGDYGPMGSVALEGTRDLATNEDGSIAYVAVDDGVATVDLSDPTSPTVLAERRQLLEDVDDGPVRLLWDVWPDGDRLLGVAQANPLGAGDLHAALLFDVSDPETPELLDHHRTEFAIHNAFFADGVAYLTANGRDGNPLVLLDTDGDELTEVGQWSLLNHDARWGDSNSAVRQLHDVYVQDDVAYLPYWDAGTWLLDVSDPADPTYISHTAEHDREELTSLEPLEAAYESQMPPGNAHYVQVDESGDLLAVGREAWSVATPGDCLAGGAGGIDLYDVSDPQSINHHATIEPPESYDQTRDGPFTTAHNFDVVGDRLYSSWYFGGVKLHDVSDPADPEELTWWRAPSETAFWTARSAVPGEHFVASSAEDVGGLSDGIEGRLYVFPDEPGEQADPPSLTDPPAGYDSLPDCEDVDTEDGAPTSGSDGEESGSSGDTDGGASGSDGAGDEGDGEDDESDALPGFGIGAAAAGLGLSAHWLRKRSNATVTDDRIR